jgi:hypothetical protein
MTSDLHKFAASGLRGFKIPDLNRLATLGLHRFKIPDLFRFATSGLRRFKIPDLLRFATLGLRRFKIPDLHRINHPENLFHEFRQTRRFEGGRFFLNSPTLAPWGSGLTPTIRLHENFQILVKKMSPSERQSGHASSGNFATVELRRVLETAPLTPINRELSLYKIFTVSSFFSEL